MFYLYLVLYLLAGYLVVRYFHKEIKAVPGVITGVLAASVWPSFFVIALFIAIAKPVKPETIDKIFGKSNKR